MIRDLAERLPEYCWVGVGRNDGKEAGEYTPIFYHRERWELGGSGHFWLSAACDLPGKGWDAVCCRVVAWAHLRQVGSGRRYFHFNTHFDHLGRNARLQSALLLLRKVQELAGDNPAIVTGDLNCRESSAPYRLLTGQLPFSEPSMTIPGLRDTRYASATQPEGPAKTYRGFLGMLGLGRIDYVLATDRLKTLRHAVLDDGAGASDHRPVLAELAFESDSA